MQCRRPLARVHHPWLGPGRQIQERRFLGTRWRTCRGAGICRGYGGQVEVAVRQPPGCYLLRVRMIGYGGTDRTVPLGSARVVEVGGILLREAPIPEWRLLFVEECALPDSVTLGSLWGTDTVRLHP